MDRRTRICKRRAPRRQQSNSQRISSELPRQQSSRLQSKHLGVCHGPQGLVEQQPTEPKALEPVGAIPYTSLPTSDPVEATIPGPSRKQFEEQLHISKKQGCSAQILPPANSRKRRIETTIETVALPVKRVHLTKTNSQQPIIENKEAEQVAKSVQQPKPLPFKRPHASLLEDLVDPLPPSPAPKRYRPESVDSSVIRWVESVSGSESYRERHCRSDTLGHSDSDIIPRRLTKSAPNMEYRRDADGFVVPPTPISTGSRSYRADAEDDSQAWYAPSVAPSNISGASIGSSRKSLVENAYYRDNNLAENNIYMRSFYEEFPVDIAGLVHYVRKDRDSPDLSLDQVKQNTRLERLEMGTGESDVERYFHAHVFPDPEPTDILQRTDRNPMAKHAVPDFGSKVKISTPVPDMLFGYNRNGVFAQQQTQFRSIGNEMVANTQGLIYPFFVIEFKADGPGGSGSMWVATNQCLGGSVSCINIAERLNCQLRQCRNTKVQLINSAAFSIAMNGTEARLYISWKHDELKYYMQKIDSFLLQKPKDYMEFRKYVLNIIDWGKDKRLKEIRKSLDSLLEENRKIASRQAKSRPPLSSDDSASSSSQKRKSSSRGCNSKAKTAQENRSGGVNELYWKLDATYNRYFYSDGDGNIIWAEDEGESSLAQQ